MKRYIGKIVTICLVLTLCLAAIGVGYGHWTKTLNIDGLAETGDFGIGFLDATVTDNEGVDPDYPDDIAETTVTLHDEDPIDGRNELMKVSIEDGYYCYRAFVNFDIHNYGSVPAVISQITINIPVGGEVDVQLDGIVDKITNPSNPTIIDPGTSVNCDLMVHVVTNSEGTYDFTVDIDAENWIGP